MRASLRARTSAAPACADGPAPQREARPSGARAPVRDRPRDGAMRNEQWFWCRPRCSTRGSAPRSTETTRRTRRQSTGAMAGVGETAAAGAGCAYPVGITEPKAPVPYEPVPYAFAGRVEAGCAGSDESARTLACAAERTLRSRSSSTLLSAEMAARSPESAERDGRRAANGRSPVTERALESFAASVGVRARDLLHGADARPRGRRRPKRADGRGHALRPGRREHERERCEEREERDADRTEGVSFHGLVFGHHGGQRPYLEPRRDGNDPYGFTVTWPGRRSSGRRPVRRRRPTCSGRRGATSHAGVGGDGLERRELHGHLGRGHHVVGVRRDPHDLHGLEGAGAREEHLEVGPERVAGGHRDEARAVALCAMRRVTTTKPPPSSARPREAGALIFRTPPASARTVSTM